MLSEEKINRLMIILTCTILVAGLYFDHSKLSGRTKGETPQTRKKVIHRKHPRSVSKRKTTLISALQGRNTGNQASSPVGEFLRIAPDMKSDESGLKFPHSDTQTRKKPDLSSSVQAFKNYAKYLEEESAK